LADGKWAIEVEMTGFASLKQEVVIGPNTPSIKWEMKMLPLGQIKAEINPAGVGARRGVPALQAKSEHKKPADSRSPASAEDKLRGNDGGGNREHLEGNIRAMDEGNGGMLPKPEELRERSLQFREAARKAVDDETTRRLATDALILAQLAEAIEREGVVGANAEKYERMLAEILGDDAVQAPTAVRRIGADRRSQIRVWRMRAEELRSTADQFEVPSAQDSLRRAAANYDKMAEHAEALVTGRPDEKKDTAG
jgi:hypothetical protein